MIKAIISDFDGTLVDTFEANLKAYQDAFKVVGIKLTKDQYRKCFGMRFDDFMHEMNINDDDKRYKIKDLKKDYYPTHFNLLKPNIGLISLIETFHTYGCKTAIASTARKENLMNAIKYLGIEDNFDLIFSGIDVKQGKPSPEIYIKTMKTLDVKPEETLIFEDSEVGYQAAKASGALFIKV